MAVVPIEPTTSALTTQALGIVPQKHPLYTNNLFSWQRSEDCFSGHDQIMRNVHMYFACPVGLHSQQLEDSGSYQQSVEFMCDRIAVGSGYNDAAKAYYSNAKFPNLMSYTINGFMSLITEHKPIVELPPEMDYFFENAEEYGDTEEDIRSFSESIINQIHLNVLKSGRCPVLVDPVGVNGQLKPGLIVYKASSVINWLVSNDAENRGQLLEVLILEYVANPNASLINNPERRTLRKYLHLRLVPAGEYGFEGDYLYIVDTYTENELEMFQKETTIPSVFGKTLNFIPLLFIGSEDNTPDVDISPLSGICVNQIKYGQLEALLAHAENHSGAPTFIITGVAEDDMPKVTGAGVAIALPDYTSKAYYTTTDTSFMTSIRERQSECLAQAEDQGANLLGSKRNTSESGEALRLRQAASTATLKSIVKNVGDGIEILLKYAATWLNLDKSVVAQVSYTPNEEFSTFALTANEQIAQLQTWQAGGFSHSTLLENFRKAGLLKPGETVEDEMMTLKKPGEKYEKPEQESNPRTELEVGSTIPPSNTLNKAIKT